MAVDINGNETQRRTPPPMTDMDQSSTGAKLPGSVTPDERAQMDLERVRGPKDSNRKPEEPKAPPVGIAPVPPGTRQRNAPAVVNPASHPPANPEQDIPREPRPVRTDAVEEGLKSQHNIREMEKAPVEVPVPQAFEKFDANKATEVQAEIVTKENDEKPGNKTVAEEPIADARPIEVDPDEYGSNIPLREKEAPKPDSKTEDDEDDEDDDAIPSDVADADKPKINDDPSVPVGMLQEEANKISMKEIKDRAEKYGVKPREYSQTDIDLMEAHSTSWYRIIEGKKNDLSEVRKRLDPRNAKIEIVDFKSDPNFEIDRFKARQNAMDGTRLVQIVAIQSGYFCMAKPLNARQLDSFGRVHANSGTYQSEQSIMRAVYDQLTDFSCGSLDFEKWMNITAYADVETLIFGIYSATFPGVNYYNLTCTFQKCRQDFTIPVSNGSIVYVPPGSITYDTIKGILDGNPFDPKETAKKAQRWLGKDLYLRDGIEFFRIISPSVMQYLEYAYAGKKQEAIDAHFEDSYNSAWIRGYGILDVEHFKKTGAYRYIFDTARPNVEFAIANLSPDDKQLFDSQVSNFQNMNRIQYQISRVRCPHCKNIVSTYPISMRNLFFEVRARKGM